MHIIGQSLTDLTLCIVYLGFAGIWGSMLSYARLHRDWLPAAAFGVLLMLPASLALPWGLAARCAAWLAAAALAWLFLARPGLLPLWLWQPRFTFGYLTVAMALIFGWCVVTSHPLLWLWMGVPASLLSVLGLRRAIQ